MADTIKGKIQNAGDSARDAARKAGEKAKSGAETAADKASSAAKSTGKAMKKAGQKLKDKSASAAIDNELAGFKWPAMQLTFAAPLAMHRPRVVVVRRQRQGAAQHAFD